MKISASIYSQKDIPLEQVVKDLDNHRIDYFHIDCDENFSVFDDIKTIRKFSQTPIDLHIITKNPKPFWPLIIENKIEWVTFQLETLENKLEIPAGNVSKIGIAITSDTDVSAFDEYATQADFILIMATTPGKSGGTFNTNNFRKIREFKLKYPAKRIHVDGGVNGEVSFILRNMGVDASVSGSYLFNAENIGFALLNLKNFETESHFHVKDFMLEKSEIPTIIEKDLNFFNALEKIETYKLGFVIITNDKNQLTGIISNADIRKGLLKSRSIENLKNNELINSNPVTVDENSTVVELLKIIKSKDFPVTYLPVINTNKEVTGAITFINLVKGEA